MKNNNTLTGNSGEHVKNNIAQDLQKNGISRCYEFLNKENLDIVEKILITNKGIKGDKNSFFYRSRKNFLLKKILNFELIGYLNSLKLINLSKKLKLKELSEKILRQPAKLTSIDSYFSPISTNKVFDWHCDQAYSGDLQPRKFLDPDHAAIKYFIYLTDVSKNNGCLGYIPQSHKILYFLKLGILNNDIKYVPYWRLNDLRNILKKDDYKSYLEKKIGSEAIIKFLEQSNFITNHSHDTYEYDFNLKKGDALIFDEGGVHRAAETLKTDRLVLRFSYKNIDAPD
jgi:hypothetical protein